MDPKPTKALEQADLHGCRMALFVKDHAGNMSVEFETDEGHVGYYHVEKDDDLRVIVDSWIDDAIVPLVTESRTGVTWQEVVT